ncbi:hypothetical protein OR1_03697 [Geobacter sp. OR-1]|uniref:hypothetical protein n=1 Tax=Geobacter sp. OR-1 TaxID=1266765 RepID=UPI000543E258|nr:hypothetical protein [Geobacter sp. OR-1]GAM11381.1 hypothetical protein OR1_03697 [Geobacter sp. OR-1]
MRKSLIILSVLPLLVFLISPVNVIGAALTEKILPKNPPQRTLIKKIAPMITVTTPKLGQTIRHCEGETFTFYWDYFGDVGRTVNIKLTSALPIRTIATAVPMQDGHGSYEYKIPVGFGWGKGGGGIFNVIIEASNGSAKGTGGKLETQPAGNKGCMNK